MVKRSFSDTFEIVVVLAIVAIVAFTGQVLIYFETHTASTEMASASSGSSSLISGFAVAEETAEKAALTDISVESVDVNPPSPLIGDPFRVTVFLKNKGATTVSTPFYIEVSFEPRGDGIDSYAPIKVLEVMPQILSPGDETSVSFLVTTIVPEGPVRIVATADSTAKLEDHNTANNQLSKTIIVAVE